MRKQILAILIAIGMCYAFAPMAGAADIDTLVVTLTPGGTVSIDVYKTIEGIGVAAAWAPSVAIGGNTATTNGTFTLENNGNVQVDVVVSASNTSAWTIETAPGHNQFNLSYQKNETGAAWTLLNHLPIASFATNFPSHTGDKIQFGLKVYMPTSSSSNSSQASTITFTGTAT